MRMLNILSFTPVLTMIAALGLPLVAQDSDPMRETVKRLETALAQIESRLQTMQGTAGVAQGSALEHLQREQAALRAQLETRDNEIAKLRASLEAQAKTAQRVADERASQVTALESKLQHTSLIAAQERDQLVQARAGAQEASAKLADARAQMSTMVQQVNALNAALGERDRRLAQQEENAAKTAAHANERERQTVDLSRELDALRGQLAEAQATAETERRAAATRLEAALAELDAALHRPPAATDSGTPTVRTEAGSVQVHHHGPGNIILNFHGAPPATSVPPKPRIEI